MTFDKCLSACVTTTAPPVTPGCSLCPLQGCPPAEVAAVLELPAEGVMQCAFFWDWLRYFFHWTISQIHPRGVKWLVPLVAGWVVVHCVDRPPLCPPGTGIWSVGTAGVRPTGADTSQLFQGRLQLLPGLLRPGCSALPSIWELLHTFPEILFVS